MCIMTTPFIELDSYFCRERDTDRQRDGGRGEREKQREKLMDFYKLELKHCC